MSRPSLQEMQAALSGEQSVRLAVLFGSTATGDNQPHSDIDILVDLHPTTFLQLAAIQQRLTDTLGKQVHLVRVSDANALLLADVFTEGKVLINHGNTWENLLRERSEVFQRATEEEEEIFRKARTTIHKAKENRLK